MIYLDSCVVIYLVEKHPLFYEPLDRQFREHTSAGFAISPLVVLECLVGPLKREDATLQARFESFFAAVAQLPNDEVVFRKAAELRAHFRIKTPDALHLATAVHVFGLMMIGWLGFRLWLKTFLKDDSISN